MASALLSARSLRTPKCFTILGLYPDLYSFLFSSLCGKSPPVSVPSQIQIPPRPKKVPFSVSVHGRTLEDPYHWMRNTTDPDFIDLLSQENSYAEAFMADTHKLQQTLFSEMTSRMPPKISTPPERWGPWSYYQYVPEGKEYPVLCRTLGLKRKGWVDAVVKFIRGGFVTEEVLLDWNEIAQQYGYVHVGTCRVSPDHNFLAYTLDRTGSEKFMLQIKDLRTAHILPKLKGDGVVSLAWAQDSRTLFYTVSDENQRPYRVLCTELGSDSLDDVPIFTEDDSNFCVDITSTKDGKFITVNSNSRTSSEVYAIDANNPQGGLHRLFKRVPGVQYFLEHHFGFFYIMTNSPLNENKKFSAGNYYLGRCRVEDTHRVNWQNIIFPSDGSSLQDMDIFNGHLVLFLNKKDSSMICSISLPLDVDCEFYLKIDDLAPWFFPMPSDFCRLIPGSNHDFMSSVYRVVLSSPVMADAIIDYDMSRHTFSMVQQEELLGVSATVQSFSQTPSNGGAEEILHDSKDQEKHVQTNEVGTWNNFSHAYSCESKEVISHDGIGVSLTLLYSRKTYRKNVSPGLLIGYGAYGEVLDKSWCADRLSLLDRGWLVAFADVRGSGGVDPSWHKSGSGLHKLNSIYDFVSCGRYLVNEGYVHKDKLGAVGHSAGCLLVGAAINMYPELFRTAILKVPFLDICNTLLDPSLPLTILDYEEFGNPQIQSHLEAILQYSPYDNIPEGACLPSILVRASLHDSRVGVWEAAKWVSKVRDITCSSCSRSIILKTSMIGGHFGEGGRLGQCEETSYEYAFLLKAMGISDHGVL